MHYHPNLKINYFKYIDTKEKAYWLGFIFAEGSIHQANVLQFQLEISKNDEILIDRFAHSIGFNTRYKKEISRDNTVRLRFKNNQFANNLIKHGMIVGKEKSKNIKMPVLKNRGLYLAFLLGYYDGDGKQGTTSLKSGSRIFLKQTKELFGLNTKISIRKYKLKDGQESEAFDFWLGAKLFNEMMDNYNNSLSRKRKRFEVYDESLRMYVMNFESIMSRILSKDQIITRDGLIIKKKQFHRYAWALGKKHKFPYTIICSLCEKYNLAKPSKDYWNENYEPFFKKI